MLRVWMLKQIVTSIRYPPCLMWLDSISPP